MTPAETPSTARPTLAGLGEQFFDLQHRHDPLNATLLGLTGFDGLLPDLRRPAEVAAADGFRRIAEATASRPPGTPVVTDAPDRDDVDRAVLTGMAGAAADDAHHCLWEANASATGCVSPQALVF